MPEGDTVWRTADRLNRALAGQALRTLEIRWGEYGGLDLLPATTRDVISRGKHLLHHLDTGVTLHTHLRMEGSWRVHTTAATTARDRANPQIRVLAATDDWTALGLRLGLVEVWPTDQAEHRLGYLGPDILGPDWDLERALANLTALPQRAIAEGLLDQRNLAGVGTFWASEGLFLQRLFPWAPVGDCSTAQLTALLERTQRLMRRGAATGIQSATGSERADQLANVHARSGRPCRRCGEAIRVAAIGLAPTERVFFYCPRCQGGLAPTDDGRPQRPMGSQPRGRRGGNLTQVRPQRR